MVKTCRACYSLALLAATSTWTFWSSRSRSVFVGAASLLVSSSSIRSFPKLPLRKHSVPSSPYLTRRLFASNTTTAAGDNNAMSSSSSNNDKDIDTDCTQVAVNLQEVKHNIQSACQAAGRENDSVRLVAVSKTKPTSLVLQAYHAPAAPRCFGENYVQELVQKSQELAASSIDDIHWHFIGPLQSNKANLLVKTVVPNAASLTVETVSTVKLAKKLDNAMAAVVLADKNDKNDADDNDTDGANKKLSIFIQVNTSGEDTKSGVEPSEVVDLCRTIVQDCPHLRVKGLMTIGAQGDVSCFDTLRSCRDQVLQEMDTCFSSLELSMGMSGDYQEAIARGATNVRVGSTIFGAREYPNKA